MKNKKEIVCFIASPSSIKDEREVCESIAQDLNKTVGDKMGFVVKVQRWETDSHPGVGLDGQDVINNQLRPENADIFVCIVGARLGSPTPWAESGTVEEFSMALNAWREHKSNKIQVYFKVVEKKFKTKEELDEFTRVEEFKQKVKESGCLYCEYTTDAEFKKKLRQALEDDTIELLRREREFDPNRIGVNAFRADESVGRFALSRRPPYVEWDAPIIHFIGVLDNREKVPGLSMFVKMKIFAKSEERVVNLVSTASIETSSGEVLFTAGCSNLGTVLENGQGIVGFYYGHLKDHEKAIKMLLSLTRREDILIKIRCDYQNETANAFTKNKTYYIDVPDSNSRAILQEIESRIGAGWVQNIRDEERAKSYSKSLQDFIYKDLDTIALDFAAGISGNFPLILAPESTKVYEEFISKCKEVIYANRLPFNGAESSFFLRTSMKSSR